VSRAAGKFLYILAVAAKAKNVVELGTSTGYSGAWLAAAMRETGGRVLTIDSDPEKVKLANESFVQAKVAPYMVLWEFPWWTDYAVHILTSRGR